MTTYIIVVMTATICQKRSIKVARRQNVNQLINQSVNLHSASQREFSEALVTSRRDQKATCLSLI